MELLVLLCGSVGGWLLVAGPVYQASIELEEQAVDQAAIAAAASSVIAPPRVSPWWWFLPPVAYLLQRRQARAHRQAVMDALGPEQQRQTITFLNKANGWLAVALGAFLIAVKETWEVVEHLHWPVAVFWVLVVVLPLVCIGNAVYRNLRTARLLEKTEAAAAARLDSV
jgi:hypothetical protein